MGVAQRRELRQHQQQPQIPENDAEEFARFMDHYDELSEEDRANILHFAAAGYCESSARLPLLANTSKLSSCMAVTGESLHAR